MPKTAEYPIIFEMMKEIKLTEKERDNLNNWYRWGQKMSFLKAIHRELEPKKAAMEEARKFIGITN